MTELEKLDAGLEFCILDKEVDARKKKAAVPQLGIPCRLRAEEKNWLMENQ